MSAIHSTCEQDAQLHGVLARLARLKQRLVEGVAAKEERNG